MLNLQKRIVVYLIENQSQHDGYGDKLFTLVTF